VTPIKEFSVVSKDINLMVNSLQNKIEELEKRETEQANAIKSFSEILGKVMRGDMSARIDTTGWNEELAAIGVSINALIENLEFEKKEKS